MRLIPEDRVHAEYRARVYGRVFSVSTAIFLLLALLVVFHAMRALPAWVIIPLWLALVVAGELRSRCKTYAAGAYMPRVDRFDVLFIAGALVAIVLSIVL